MSAVRFAFLVRRWALLRIATFHMPAAVGCRGLNPHETRTAYAVSSPIGGNRLVARLRMKSLGSQRTGQASGLDLFCGDGLVGPRAARSGEPWRGTASAR